MITRRRLLTGTIATGVGAALGQPARAQAFPAKPLKVILPYTAGSPNDVIARVIGPVLSARLGQGVASVGRRSCIVVVEVHGSDAPTAETDDHFDRSLVVGLLGMLLLIPLANGAGWLVSGLDDYDGVLALAAFSSLFKLMGVLVFFPWLDTYARLIV